MATTTQHLNYPIDSTHSLKLHISSITDPGTPDKPNQDTMFVYTDDQKNNSTTPANVVIGILDGHGSELGTLAAENAAEYFQQTLEDTVDIFEQIQAQPQETLNRIFEGCHLHLKKKFRQFYESKGFTVKDDAKNQYLLKRLRITHSFSCVHGGTTCTLVFILQGKHVTVANVGDSNSLLAGPSFTENLLRTKSQTESPEDSPKNYAVINADHSPESKEEYVLARQAKEHPEFKDRPHLSFFYDTTTRMNRSLIFELDEATKKLTLTNNGDYYKNVRREWASLVSTPKEAKFKDSLSFTRSLGDFHLHSYGVSHLPSVRQFNLHDIIQKQIQGNDHENLDMVLVTASDGIWDCWQYEKLLDYLLTEERLKQSHELNGTAEIAQDLIRQNLRYAHDLFGRNCDNMTAVLCYLEVTKRK